MAFQKDNYVNFVAEKTSAQSRLFRDYDGSSDYFDYVIIGSGMGGGLLADDLAERVGGSKRILVVEAGSFLYPTHVYNMCRIPNASIAKHFGVDTFWQQPSDRNFIGEKPQLNFGGRSIFWSGLIPTVQPWELDFFPEAVKQDLSNQYLAAAGQIMNESVSMGPTTARIVERLRNSPLSQDFIILETPRALHQPYLNPDGTPSDQYFVESTGVFNTAELLINQVGLTPGAYPEGPGLHVKLNSFVESVNRRGSGLYEITTTDTTSGQARQFVAPQVVLAAGSIESPKLLQRSDSFQTLPDAIKYLVGRGLTDHPTTASIHTRVTNLGNLPITKAVHGKLVFYSRGNRDSDGSIRFPFNIEMNINHEYWHLRENDPTAGLSPVSNTGDSIVDIKFSFGNCIDDANVILSRADNQYTPEIRFKNLSYQDDLYYNRLPTLAGWQKNADEVYSILNNLTWRIFSQFQYNGAAARPEGESWFGPYKNFGYGTVHHAAGTLRMPYRLAWNQDFRSESVVDQDLKVANTEGLYVCDMSVMPFSSAANPVRTLGGLALRLSKHLAA